MVADPNAAWSTRDLQPRPHRLVFTTKKVSSPEKRLTPRTAKAPDRFRSSMPLDSRLGDRHADFLRDRKFFNFFPEILPKKSIWMMKGHFSEGMRFEAGDF
jgi:hypothetical protein